MYIKASKLQRFLSFLVDYLIIRFLVTFTLNPFLKLCKFDLTSYTNAYNNFLDTVKNYYSGNSTTAELMKTLSTYMDYYYIVALVTLGLTFIYVLLFLVIVPIIFKGKSFGRMAVGLEIVDKNNEPAKISKIILRELLGSFVFYYFLGWIGGLISLILLLTQKRSIADVISKTETVVKSKYQVKIDEFKSVDSFDQNRNETKQEDNEPTLENKDKSSDNGGEDVLDNDDEYTVI